jgi:hypothetical protein
MDEGEQPKKKELQNIRGEVVATFEPKADEPKKPNADARSIFRRLGKWTAVVVAFFVALVIGVGLGAAVNPSDDTASANPETVTVASTVTGEGETVTETVTETISATKVEKEKLNDREAELNQRAAELRQGEKELQRQIGIVQRTSFGAGTYLVGKEITPGTYRSSGKNGCYWERLSGLGGDFGDIIANDNPTGPALVAISSSDKAFSSDRCGTWRRVE